MAKQKGILKIEGTIGDITFLKTQDGYLAREKTSLSGERIATDASFQRTRENMAEFGRAGKAGKLLRNAIRSLLQNAKEPRIASRLVKEMMKVLQSDTTNVRGERNIVDGDIALLEGFDFNSNARLTTTLHAPFTVAIDRAAGNMTLDIPAFVPANSIAAPAGATHFKIATLAAEIDFSTEQFSIDVQETGLLPWDNATAEALNVENALTANSTKALFYLMGIQFFQQVNGVAYALKNGAYNALAIVKVEAA